MWRGDLHKAGIEANGFDINVFNGNVYAKNFPGGGLLGLPFGESAQNWYVDGNVTASGNGETWANAFKTITEAVAAAGTNDVIWIAPYSYNEGAAITITTSGLKLIGPGGNTVWPSWITNSAAHHLLVVNAANVVIYGLEFWQTEAASDCIILNSNSAQIINCSVSCTGTGRYGIDVADDWNLIDQVSIYDCVTAGIRVDDDSNIVRNCTIDVIASGIGIDVIASGDEFNKIYGNIIRGMDDSDTGIKLAAGLTADELTLAWNYVDNCATPVTVGFDTALYDGNFWGKNDADYHSVAGTFFVDANVAATGDGRSWISAFKTFTEAVAAAVTRNDKILVKPGDYDETATIAVATQGLQIIGVNGVFSQNKAMIYDGGGGGYHLMTIDAHEVIIDGLAFSAAADTYDGIHVGDTTGSYKVTIRNCRFDGWSGEYGIKAGAVNDCPDILVENNLFRSWNTAACYVNCTRAVVRNNHFHVVTDCIGLEHIPAGGNRPDNCYVDNYFSGVANASTTGIKFTGAPNNGTIMCMRNYFAGTWDTSITQIAAHAGVNNYVANNAGGALIDTVT